MPKTTYQPTEADALTGQNVRRLRRAASETLTETIERAGLTFSGQSLSRVELGQRQLTVPEATKLAAHFNTTVDKIIAQAPVDTPPTEQAWLGNEPEKAPSLFAVPDLLGASAVEIGRTITIDLDSPLSPDQYRDQVWIPYLESRYATDLKQTG